MSARVNPRQAQAGNFLYTERLWYHMCSCQPTLGLRTLSLYKFCFHCTKSPFYSWLTYGTIAFPCVKSSLYETTFLSIYFNIMARMAVYTIYFQIKTGKMTSLMLHNEYLEHYYLFGRKKSCVVYLMLLLLESEN